MNNSYKYVLGTTEIIAFICGVLLLMTLSKSGILSDELISEMFKLFFQALIIAFFASLFGAVTGGLVGFLGIVCSYAVAGKEILFSSALGFAVYGCLIGQFANRYLIREGAFRLRQLLLWNVTNVFSLITAFVFIVPFFDYFVYKVDLVESLGTGLKLASICVLCVGAILSLLFFVISALMSVLKKHSLAR